MKKNILISILLSFLFGFSFLMNFVFSDFIDYEKGNQTSLNQNIEHVKQLMNTKSFYTDKLNSELFVFKNEKIAKEDMISFFDDYRKKYNLSLSRLFYIEENKAYLEMTFKTENKVIAEQLFSLKYEGGFILFKELSVQHNLIKGRIILMQPIGESK